MLELEGIDCHYAKVHVLRGVSLVVNRGEIVSMIGPNAAGKTTTLRVMAGLKQPSAGRIRYLGEDITRMLPIGRGLMAQPKSLLLDEPSLGLAPIVVSEIARTIRELASRGLTIMLVEQNAAMALELADRAYLLESGHISLHGTAADLQKTDVVRKLYLGA